MIKNRTSHASIWLALGSVYVVWGSTYMAIRVLALHHMPPFLTAGFRFIVAGVVLFLATRAMRDEADDRVTPSHWRSAFIVGGLLLLGGNGGVVFAEQRVNSGIAALMIAATPLWFALFSRVFLKEKIGRLAVAGIFIGFMGIVILNLPSGGQVPTSRSGTLALLWAPMAWAAGSLFSKSLPMPRRTLIAMSMEMFAGGGLLFLAGLVTGEQSRFHLGQIDKPSLIAFVYLVVFGSLVGFTSYIWVLGKAKTSLVSTYAYVNPIVAVLLGAAFLHERLGLRTGFAAAVIVTGVAMIVTSSSRTHHSELDYGSPADSPGPGRPDPVSIA